MINRVNFLISNIDLPNKMFIPFNNLIHIDEKWFYMNQISRKIYQSPTEKEPISIFKNKSFIRKVMFLVAVEKPRQDHGRKVLLDGKLGCWTLTKVVPCSSNRKNRKKGTMVMKEITSVDKTLINNIFIRELLPSIVEKFPKDRKEINIQLDNASPHIKTMMWIGGEKWIKVGYR